MSLSLAGMNVTDFGGIGSPFRHGVAGKVFRPIGPYDRVADTDEPAQDAGAFRNCKPRLRIDPPGDELGDPTVRRPDCTSPGYTGGPPHIERLRETMYQKLFRREVRQLVEADQWDLRTLPVQDRLVVLEVAEADRRTRWECPLKVRSTARDAADIVIELLALVPQSALVSDLDERPPKEDPHRTPNSRRAATAPSGAPHVFPPPAAPP